MFIWDCQSRSLVGKVTGREGGREGSLRWYHPYTFYSMIQSHQSVHSQLCTVILKPNTNTNNKICVVKVALQRLCLFCIQVLPPCKVALKTCQKFKVKQGCNLELWHVLSDHIIQMFNCSSFDDCLLVFVQVWGVRCELIYCTTTLPCFIVWSIKSILQSRT